MHLTSRSTALAVPLALTLTATVFATASAQVATLVAPDETPEPEAAAVQQEFEFEDRQEAILVFAQCMRDNGIDMDDPTPGQGGGGGGFLRAGGPGGGGFDEFGEDFQLAQQACSPILEAARPDLDPVLEAERLEEQLLLAQCLRDNGYEQYPDPVLGSDGRLQRTGRSAFSELGIDFRSESFQNARGTCAAEIGIEFGGGRGGRGGAN